MRGRGLLLRQVRQWCGGPKSGGFGGQSAVLLYICGFAMLPLLLKGTTTGHPPQCAFEKLLSQFLVEVDARESGFDVMIKDGEDFEKLMRQLLRQFLDEVDARERWL